MATTIITKNGSGAPSAGALSIGELAVDLTNKRLYTKNNQGVIPIGGSGDSGEWEQNGNDIYYNDGNVGIGTSSPASPLEVSGTGPGTLFRVRGDSASLLVQNADTNVVR